MSGLKCPFCGAFSPDIYETFQRTEAKFQFPSGAYDQDWRWIITTFRCPNCQVISYTAVGSGKNVKGKKVKIYPESSAIKFPDYIPAAIREDYEEACSICDKSPKAAAALARRCLQGMIHDFWDIHEKNLNAEITKLKDFVPAAQWKAIDAIRSIGNIGAHMEQDVNLIIDVSPEEAETLLTLIELLISKWYVNRHDEEELYNQVSAISAEKAELRRS